MKVLAAARKAEHKVSGVGGRGKCRKMKFCLAEGLRQLNAVALTNCETASLHQDVRDGMLAVRFQCCDLSLNVSKGLLGQCNLAKDLFCRMFTFRIIMTNKRFDAS